MSQTNEITGGEALARLQRSVGESTILVRDGRTNKGFLLELLGRAELREGNYDIVHAIGDTGIPTYGGRHEGAMAHAADGFCRATGEVAAGARRQALAAQRERLELARALARERSSARSNCLASPIRLSSRPAG